MLDDALFSAFKEIKNVLKEKYPKKTERIFYLILIIVIVVTPMFLFEYWLGRISGLILVSLMFFTLVTKSKNE